MTDDIDVDLRPLTDDEVFDLLEAPFEDHEIKQRAGDHNRMLNYIDAPTARRRLNFALGRAGWECDMKPCEGGVMRAITIRLPSGLELRRADLGGYPKMTNPEDAFKGGASDAFKRAAVLFGVGAYLGQGDDQAGSQRAPHRKERGAWGGGARPAAQPEGDRGGARAGGQPRTGRALYARLNEVEKANRAYEGLFDHVLRFGVDLGYPKRMTEWSFDQVKAAEGEAHRFCAGEIANAH